VIVGRFRLRFRALASELDGLFDLCFDVRDHVIEFVLGDDAVLEQPLPIVLDRIHLLFGPLVGLLVAVGLLVPFEVGNETDDAVLDDRRSLAVAGAFDRLGDRVVHFLDVAAVDALGRHVMRNPVIREVIRRQRFGGRRDGPLVVLDDEHDRQVPVRGEDERRVERAATRPTIADSRHRHVVGSFISSASPRPTAGF